MLKHYELKLDIKKRSTFLFQHVRVSDTKYVSILVF